jgi:sugar phosphate isomerase/epimerase
MPDGLKGLAINSATVRQMGLRDLIDACPRFGFDAVTPWRNQVQEMGVSAAARYFSDAGISVAGYCRAGLFAASTAGERRRIADDNRLAVDEAFALGAESLIILAGGLPGVGAGNPDRDLVKARGQVADGIAALLEHASGAGIRLAIEPLHPMYAADRCCINSLEQALDLCDALDPARSGLLGVAVDVYHLWWDPKLRAQIGRAGPDRLLGFHLSDWLVPTLDMLNDRGLMGDGVIDLPAIRGWIYDAGYRFRDEVEIFSERLWKLDGIEVLQQCAERCRVLVGQK